MTHKHLFEQKTIENLAVTQDQESDSISEDFAFAKNKIQKKNKENLMIKNSIGRPSHTRDGR